MSKIRVLVVDDTVVMRQLVSKVLGGDSDIEVCGVAANGKIALQKIPQVNPDLITLDVEMPEMDGISTLKEIRKVAPKLPVIMLSTLTERGGITTLEALSLGANDYVTKPTKVTDLEMGMRVLRDELVPKVRLHCRDLLGGSNGVCVPQKVFKPREKNNFSAPSQEKSGRVRVVCVGSSTGGPNALDEFFRAFPQNFPVPVLVVQHMPPLFTKLLAERFDTEHDLSFHEGTEGQEVLPGHVYIAPGGHHMEIRKSIKGGAVRIQDEMPENSCRPAVDVLFRSAVRYYGGDILSVILTGMGQDGLRGCQMISEHGGYVMVQDEESSVVWGMPGSVAEAGGADQILPLSEIGTETVRRTMATWR